MKAETWIFGVNTVFFGLVAPAYWFITYDPTGTAALVMTALLVGLVTFYLGFHASKMEPRSGTMATPSLAQSASLRRVSAATAVSGKGFPSAPKSS